MSLREDRSQQKAVESLGGGGPPAEASMSQVGKHNRCQVAGGLFLQMESSSAYNRNKPSMELFGGLKLIYLRNSTQCWSQRIFNMSALRLLLCRMVCPNSMVSVFLSPISYIDVET